jgi:hypothetical protein|tara:strand:- start:241 stop:348 length:108 start_codon:yes stop_codon:yes gene_type:complete
MIGLPEALAEFMTGAYSNGVDRAESDEDHLLCAGI